MTAVTTWELEMRDPAALCPAPPPRLPVELRRVETPSPEFSRFLYTAVGGDWYWTDRERWSYPRWQGWLDRPEVTTWVAWSGGNPAGYAELERQSLAGTRSGGDGGEQVELAYLGLLPQFRGAGVGGWLLTEALRRAWAMGPLRVWVHTCTLDGPAALPNYVARGLEVVDERCEEQALPPRPTGPWPGARD